MRAFPVALLLAIAVPNGAAVAQQLGERLPGQRAETGMPRSDVRGARPCPQYGPGFVRLEGSTTCVRLGGHIRFEAGAVGGRGRDHSPVGTRAGAMVEIDARTPTDAGDMRMVVRGHFSKDTGAMVGQPWR